MNPPLLNVSGHRTRRVVSCVRAMAGIASAGFLGALALACGEAGPDGAVLTIAECQELGGSPFFDPEDERPLEMSCPEGLGYLGEFDEPFFGADGGICCSGPARSEA
jgi:hypothetical protein